MENPALLHAAGALQQHYCAGMPQLSLYGLSENWLLKECGHLHWQAIAGARGQSRPAFADVSGARSYAALTAVHLHDAHLDAVDEHAPFSLSARVHAPGRAQHFSTQTLRCGNARAARVELLSAFIRREASSNRSIVRAAMDGSDAPGDRALASAALSLQARARLFRAGQAMPRMGLAPLAADACVTDRVTLTPCPHSDFNGAGLLYFASFQSLADRAELALCGHMPALTAERELYFYGNIDPGESVNLELLAQRADEEEFAHWWRVVRSADGARIADLITRKRRLR